MRASISQCPFRGGGIAAHIAPFVRHAVSKLTPSACPLQASGGNCMFSLTLYRDGESDNPRPVEGLRGPPGARNDKVNDNSEDHDDVPHDSQPSADDAGAPRRRRRTAGSGDAGTVRRPSHSDRQPQAHRSHGGPGPGLRRRVARAAGAARSPRFRRRRACRPRSGAHAHRDVSDHAAPATAGDRSHGGSCDRWVIDRTTPATAGERPAVPGGPP